MKLTNIVNMNFEDNPVLPEIIYKYRKWDDEYQKTILTKRIVFMAPPTSFKDQKDCKLLKRYDLMTEQDIYLKYIEMSKRKNPNWTRQKHRAFAREWTKKSPMKDKNYIKKMREEHLIEFDKRFGVLSLTADPSNFKMWKGYSDVGRGLCVGFDPKKMFKYLGGGGPVQYYDNLPDILHDDNYHIEHFKQVFSKERKWEFEEEYRTYKFYPEPASTPDRQIVIPPETFKEVIFGWNISKLNKNEMMKVCKLQKLNISFKEVELKNGDMKIKPAINRI